MSAAAIYDSAAVPMRIPSRAWVWSRADKAALIVIGLCVVALVGSWRLHVPAMSDTWYHLALADKWLGEGWVPGWDSWEFAPYGRPNLYPPLIHGLLALGGAITGDVMSAGHVLAVLFLPLGLLTNWLCVRRLLGAGAAFLAVLIMLLDLSNLIIMEAYIPACLVNILVPLLVMAVLARRSWWAIAVMTALYYSHLGFPHVVALGLLVFGLAEREYLQLALKTIAISFLFWTPWLAHVLAHLEWVAKVLGGGGLPGPLLMKVFSLQTFNVIVIVLGLLGARRMWRAGGPARIVPAMMIGFLPILLSYGGRYMMHCLPMWAAAGALAVRGIVPVEPTRLRLALLGLIPLLPTPAVSFFGKPGPQPITSAMIMAALPFQKGPMWEGKERNERYGPDCDALAAWLRVNTSPGEVVFTNKEWLADAIALLADRPTDFGAWWECGTDAAKRWNRAWRDEQPRATFVCIKPDSDVGSILRPTETMPPVDELLELGRFWIGLRHEHQFLDPGTRVPLDAFRVLPYAGVAGSVSVETSWLRWSTPPQPGGARISVIEAPLPRSSSRPAPGYAGVRLLVTSSKPEPLTLGCVTESGRELRAQITIATADEEQLVTVPLSWTTAVDGDSPPRRDGIRRIYLAWAPEGALGERVTWVRAAWLMPER